MKSKTIKMLAIAFFPLMAFSSGLYFVSGIDMRYPIARMIYQTTTQNEEVEITPYKVRTLSVYGNQQWAGEWSVKGSEFDNVFSNSDNIRQGNGNVGEEVGILGCTNAYPFSYVFPTTGNHLVKLFSETYNVYQKEFIGNSKLTHLEVNDDVPTQNKFFLVTKVQSCQNLKSFIWKNPGGLQINQAFPKESLTGVTNLVNLKISNPEYFNNINYESFLRDCRNLTNDIVFLNVTNIGNYALHHVNQINYASFPKIRKIGTELFSNAQVNSSNTKNKNLGLKTIRIGEDVEYVGKNTFYGHENLHTIEFATQSPDNWVSRWNDNAVITNWIGTISLSATNPNEASLIPNSGTDTYYSGTRRIGSNTDITIKVVRVQK